MSKDNKTPSFFSRVKERIPSFRSTDSQSNPDPQPQRSMESYFLQADNQPYDDPRLDQYNVSHAQFFKVANNISIISTLGGYTSSTATAFTSKIPLELHRNLYNLGSGMQSLVRLCSTSPCAYSSPEARDSVVTSKIWSGISVAASIAVMGFMACPQNASTVARIFRSSAGFNITGITNILGAAYMLRATNKQSEADMQRLGDLVEERTGLDRKTVDRILREEVPHVTQEEKWTRGGGLFFSGMGSVTGLAGALVSMFMPGYTRLAMGLGKVSGLSFGAGLALPLFGAPNTPGERKFSDTNNEHFEHIRNNGMHAMIPWAVLTTLGSLALMRGRGGAFANQFKIHGLDKCDNSLGLLAFWISVFTTEQNPFRNWEAIYQPFGVRGFYSGVDRCESARITYDDYLNGESTRPYAQQITASTEREFQARELARQESERLQPIQLAEQAEKGKFVQREEERKQASQSQSIAK